MGSPGTGHGRRVGVLPGSVFLVRVFFHPFCFFCFVFAAKSVVPWRRKGLLPWSLTQYFVCPHSLLNLLFSGFTHTIGGLAGGWAGKKDMWALFYISISAAFSMGWDYAERMLYFLLGCSLWIKAFWCLLSSYSPLRTRSQTRNTIIVINRKLEMPRICWRGKGNLSSPLAIAGLFAHEGRRKPYQRALITHLEPLRVLGLHQCSRAEVSIHNDLLSGSPLPVACIHTCIEVPEIRM